MEKYIITHGTAVCSTFFLAHVVNASIGVDEDKGGSYLTISRAGATDKSGSMTFYFPDQPIDSLMTSWVKFLESDQKTFLVPGARMNSDLTHNH